MTRALDSATSLRAARVSTRMLVPEPFADVGNRFLVARLDPVDGFAVAGAEIEDRELVGKPDRLPDGAASLPPLEDRNGALTLGVRGIPASTGERRKEER
jgi:hypothetical protein